MMASHSVSRPGGNTPSLSTCVHAGAVTAMPFCAVPVIAPSVAVRNSAGWVGLVSRLSETATSATPLRKVGVVTVTSPQSALKVGVP